MRRIHVVIIIEIADLIRIDIRQRRKR